MTKKIVVFASGSGSNFQSIINATETGSLQAEICGLITNRDNIGAIERAKLHGIQVFIIRAEDFETLADYENNFLEKLEKLAPDLIILAGYLKKIPDAVLNEFEGKILNIHPSLLPAYGGKGMYGQNVHQAVLKSGDTRSGCSVHIVTAEYDEGPVIAQDFVEVKPGDTAETLAARVLEKEHALYPKVIQQFLHQKNTVS